MTLLDDSLYFLTAGGSTRGPDVGESGQTERFST